MHTMPVKNTGLDKNSLVVKNTAQPVLLALDTSTRTVGLAVYDGVKVLSEFVWENHDYHTAELAPAVAEALRRSRVDASDLGALGVATGPGSFTGLRIGLALAKGLALANHIPLIGVATLDILAAAQPTGDLPLAVVLHAGRGRLAVGWYQDVDGSGWKLIKPVEVLTPQELSAQIQKPTRVSGELDEDERRLLARKRRNVILASPAHSLRRPSFLAEVAWGRWQAGQTDDPASLAPVYLHYNNQQPLIPG